MISHPCCRFSCVFFICSVVYTADPLLRHNRLQRFRELVFLCLCLCQIFTQCCVIDLNLRLCSGRTNDNSLVVLQLVDQNICLLHLLLCIPQPLSAGSHEVPA